VLVQDLLRSPVAEQADATWTAEMRLRLEIRDGDGALLQWTETNLKENVAEIIRGVDHGDEALQVMVSIVRGVPLGSLVIEGARQ
jgi:hypothetical protein